MYLKAGIVPSFKSKVLGYIPYQARRSKEPHESDVKEASESQDVMTGKQALNFKNRDKEGYFYLFLHLWVEVKLKVLLFRGEDYKNYCRTYYQFLGEPLYQTQNNI